MLICLVLIELKRILAAYSHQINAETCSKRHYWITIVCKVIGWSDECIPTNAFIVTFSFGISSRISSNNRAPFSHNGHQIGFVQVTWCFLYHNFWLLLLLGWCCVQLYSVLSYREMNWNHVICQLKQIFEYKTSINLSIRWFNWRTKDINAIKLMTNFSFMPMINHLCLCLCVCVCYLLSG